MKRFTIRAARKTAHLSNKLLHKGLRITAKVEDKATRILSGTDYSFQVDTSIPLEKIYYNSLPYIIPLNPAMPAIGATATITLLIPSLDHRSFFGGTATALVVAAKLAIKSNRRLRIVQTLKTGDGAGVSKFLKSEGISLASDRIQVISVADRAYNVYGYISMHPDDIYMASAWWDAHLISKLPITKKFVYLIQDFEPIFYNNSDSYVLAENTYKLKNYVALCNTELMHEFMSQRHYPAFSAKNKSFWFEPAVSRLGSGTIKAKKQGEKKRIFLYGRPNVHRNLFFTALTALDYAFTAGFLNKEEWECYMAGQDSLPDVDLPSRIKVKNLGKMSMEKYTEFSKTIDMAISPMMAPHPNYPTLEFSSIGAAVVTTKYANKQDLSRYSEDIFMSDIDAESMAGAIQLAAKTTTSDRIKRAKTANIPSSWNKSLDDAIAGVLASLE